MLLQGAVVGLFSLQSLGVPLVAGRVDSGRLLRGSLVVTLVASALMCASGLFLPDSAPRITALTCLFIVGLVWPSSCYFAMIFEAFPGLKGSA